MDAKDGEINCMVFRLALYLASTTPNKPTAPPRPIKQRRKLPPTLSNQEATAMWDSAPIRSTASSEVVPM